MSGYGDLPDLRFNFHDANLESVSLGPRREATLRVALYPIFYPDAPRVEVRVGAVLNSEEVRKYLQLVLRDSEPDCYLARFDALHFDLKKPPKPGDMRLFLDLDHYGALQIHCGSLSVRELEPT